MLDIFKWEYTINETCQGHFPWKNSILLKKKKHKIASAEKSHLPTKKNTTALVFVLE